MCIRDSDWLGWHYPYQVYYGYTAGSLLIEMVDLTADRQSNRCLLYTSRRPPAPCGRLRR